MKGADVTCDARQGSCTTQEGNQSDWILLHLCGVGTDATFKDVHNKWTSSTSDYTYCGYDGDDVSNFTLANVSTDQNLPCPQTVTITNGCSLHKIVQHRAISEINKEF